MIKILRSPGKYVQGRGALAHLWQHLQPLGKKPLLIASAGGKKRIEPILSATLPQEEHYVFETTQGECCQAELDRLTAVAQASGCGVICGIGGGKVADLAKAVAHYAELPLAIIPTVASSDAPCSALSVMYHENGEFDRYLFLRQSPQLVLVDLDMIAKAPARLLAAGMGDALATWFEARAVARSGKNNQVGGKPPLAATRMAQLCFEVLKADGPSAMMAVKEKCCTPALERVVEVNTYLSSVGFESGGLAAAHTLQKGFTLLREMDGAYHGEKVAFGTLAQLVLEHAPQEELDEVLQLCTQVGLPVTLAQLGAPNVSRAEMQKVAEFSCLPGSTIHNLPFEFDADDICDALLTADALGRSYLQAHGLSER